MAKSNKTVERPLGVTILSILGFIGAGLLVLLGIAMVGLGSMMSYAGMLGVLFGGLGAFAGIFILVLGIVEFVINYGLWNMKKWAWTVTLILEGIGLLSSLASLSILGIIISGVIVWYLWTKKDLFG
ncbi:Uncharacterised protein [uncultured archaeon]|nr:Uncharacterised protein [uncultured archaeon]